MRRYFLLVSCIFLSAFLFAGTGYLKNFSINEGLPSAESYCVFQDSKGYIWIGTDMGVSRYDGYSFKTYTTEDGLVDNTVFAFTEDSKGRIWFSSFSGKIAYYFNDSIYGQGFTVNDKLASYIGAGSVTGIREHINDTLLLATSQGMLKILPRLQNGENTWDAIQVVNPHRSYLLNDGYMTVEAIGETATHITCYTGLNKAGEVNLPSKRVGIVSVYGNTKEFIQMNYSLCSYQFRVSGDILKTDSITSANCVLPINNAELWIGAERKGAQLYSMANKLTVPSMKVLDGLSVSGILRDRENGYWFTTIEEGLFYMPSDKFVHYTIEKREIPVSRITGMTVTSKGLWFTSATKILQVNSNHNVVPILTEVTENISHYQYLWDVYEFEKNELWLATNGGIAIIDAVEKQLKSIIKRYSDTAQSYLPSQQLLKDRQGYVWSLNTTSIIKIDANKKEILKVIPIPSRAQTMCENSNGDILIGTLAGMYSCKNDSLYYLGEKNVGLRNRFVDIKKFQGSTIVAATRGAGIYIISDTALRQIGNAEGLSSNMCRGLCVDADRNIWVATNNGLNVVQVNLNPFKVSVRKFTVADGLLSNDVERVVKYGDDVWVYTKKGLTRFNPDSVGLNNVPPPVYITGLYIDNVSTKIGKENELSYKTNFTRIDYVGLTYKNSGNKIYRYKLEGYADEWLLTTSTFVQFTKLPPGKYRFIVSCINNAGIESQQPAIFSFTIGTPVYLRWWFIFSIATAVLTAILALYLFNVNRIKKNESAKAEVNSRIAKLELQALQAQMNPHFIFNCLNAIQDFILKNDAESAIRYLNKFAKLIRNTLNNSRRQDIPLADEIEFLSLYTDLEQMRFSNKFDCTVAATPVVNISSIEIPSMIIQPFVENAIRHGQISHMKERGKIEVAFNIDEGTLVCSISDNGVGIKRSLLEKTIVGPRQAHALDIIDERIKTLNEVGKFVITYKITDKSDVGEGCSGTYVEVRIKQKQKQVQ